MAAARRTTRPIGSKLFVLNAMKSGTPLRILRLAPFCFAIARTRSSTTTTARTLALKPASIHTAVANTAASTALRGQRTNIWDFPRGSISKRASWSKKMRPNCSAKAVWTRSFLWIYGVTDCYQPVERKLKLTRRCLEVLAEFRNPVAIITKNILVTRDIDLLASLASDNAAAVNISVTTLDPTLTPKLEPRAPLPNARLGAIAELSRAGVPVGVLVAPVIPALTDHEMPAIIAAAVHAGARWAGYVPLRLPFGIKGLFETWLQQHFPDRKDKVLNRVRALRGGKLNDPRFGTRMRGEGVFAEQLEALFVLSCRKAGLTSARPELSTASFHVPSSASSDMQKTFPF